MTRMLLVAMGSAGDVNPFVGIGLALQRRRHDVTVITNEHFRSAVEQTGLSFAPAGTDAQYAAAIDHPDFWHPTKGPAALFGLAIATMPETVERVVELNKPGETILVAPPQALGAPIAAEKLDIPFVSAFPNPLLLRSVHCPPKTPMMSIPSWIGPWGIGLLYRYLEGKLDGLLGEKVNAYRASLGLLTRRAVYRSWRDQAAQIIGMWPEWLYEPQLDWPKHANVTGFIEYDGKATVSSNGTADSDAFDLNDVDDHPIVFTCGSAMAQGSDFYAAAAESCRILDRPGILLTQHTRQLPTSLPAGVRHVCYAPLAQLLPKASALVHHGGAGTMGRGLKAGIPQVVMPLAYDQFDNLDRLQRLGVGDGVKRKGLTGRKMAVALYRLLESPAVHDRCKYYASRLRDSDPLEQTCNLIEGVLK